MCGHSAGASQLLYRPLLQLKVLLEIAMHTLGLHDRFNLQPQAQHPCFFWCTAVLSTGTAVVINLQVMTATMGTAHLSIVPGSLCCGQLYSSKLSTASTMWSAVPASEACMQRGGCNCLSLMTS